MFKKNITKYLYCKMKETQLLIWQWYFNINYYVKYYVIMYKYLIFLNTYIIEINKFFFKINCFKLFNLYLINIFIIVHNLSLSLYIYIKRKSNYQSFFFSCKDHLFAKLQNCITHKTIFDLSCYGYYMSTYKNRFLAWYRECKIYAFRKCIWSMFYVQSSDESIFTTMWLSFLDHD